MKFPKDWRKIKKSAESQGWSVVQTSKHIKWTSPGGEVVISGSTPSDPRAGKNFLSRLRQRGLKDI